ncbi:MAG: polymerase sigma factor SigW [Candidatus Parcubacteria bacterium]|jgi:RNA polymerase sigma-70 factor (ECF subfamily)
MQHLEEETTDERIALRVQAGDQEAFGILVQRYGQKILRYARKFLFGYQDAEDMAQEVFIKAFVNIRSFDATRKFSSWLYRIAHNEFVDAIKRKKREPIPFFDPDELFPHPVSQSDPGREAEAVATRASLEAHLDALDPKYREPLVLYYFEELDYGEISEVLRIPVSTVGVRLKRGREALAKRAGALDPAKT